MAFLLGTKAPNPALWPFRIVTQGAIPNILSHHHNLLLATRAQRRWKSQTMVQRFNGNSKTWEMVPGSWSLRQPVLGTPATDLTKCERQEVEAAVGRVAWQQESLKTELEGLREKAKVGDQLNFRKLRMMNALFQREMTMLINTLKMER